MKKKSGFSFWGGVIFFLTIAAVVTVAVVLYGYVDERSGGNKKTISLVMFLVVLFLSLFCTVADIFRRRFMVDTPAEKILDATERIAAGDFSVRLRLKHPYGNYDEFDYIMENLNIMAAELEKSEILKTDFISNVSHELKTPLTVIRNYALLLQTETDEETRKKYAAELADAANRLSLLITNILKLNKLENDKILPAFEAFRLDESLVETALGFEELMENKKIDLVVSLDEVCVLSSKSYLEIVWNNLLSNAIKFTNDGGRVELKLKKEGKNAVVSVVDTGCGIDAETGKRIFDKFYQGDTSHAKEGNGLGLALVKRVIDILGGEISVSSEVGKGTAFTVTLKNAVEE